MRQRAEPAVPLDRDIPVERDGKLIRGQDGWLFLAHDSNDVLSQQSGELTFTARDLRDWQRLLETRRAWLAERGAAYFFLAAPDAHSVYPEKLPSGFSDIAKRPVEQLVEHLERADSRQRIIYPISEMVARKADLSVYSPTDTHWNEAGGFVAYNRLLDDIEQVAPVRRVPANEVEFFERDVVGDLGAKMDPPESSGFVFADIRSRKRELVSDNCVRNRGRRIEYRCEAAPDTTCLLLADSYSGSIIPFLGESFRRLVFAHTFTLDFEVFEEVKPRVVVSVMAERFMISLPFDIPALTLEEVAAKKMAEGKVFDDRAFAEYAARRG